MSELITTSSKVVSQIVEDMQQQRLENREKRTEACKTELGEIAETERRLFTI